MIELPALAPFDMETDFEGLSATAMLGRSDEIYADGMPGWKHNPGEMGVGVRRATHGLVMFNEDLAPAGFDETQAGVGKHPERDDQ